MADFGKTRVSIIIRLAPAAERIKAAGVGHILAY